MCIYIYPRFLMNESPIRWSPTTDSPHQPKHRKARCWRVGVYRMYAIQRSWRGHWSRPDDGHFGCWDDLDQSEDDILWLLITCVDIMCIYIYPIVYHCIKVVTSELWPVPLQIQPGASFLSRWWTCWDQRFFRGGWKTLWPCLITAVTWPKNKIKHQLKTVKDDEVVRLLTKNLWLIMSDKLVRMNQILN